MKRIFYFVVFLIVSISGYAQELGPANSFSAGLQIANYQKDFGIGLNIASPYFAGDYLAIRVRSNMMWYEHIDNNSKFTWTTYSNHSLGLASVAGRINDNFRLYGEGGLILILPSSAFSSEDIEVGGYGLFGFEFHFSTNDNYYIELGSVGTGAIADKVPGEPIYSNGFAINVGYRHHF
ncbi:hypothetical protein HZR84_10425 [Hyphobacterium sp. CCMP332]|nr:hypothetical protein HZR84_10425 [Hyphobacterium sp. CCMP332]